MRWSPILLAVLSGVVCATEQPEHAFPVNPQVIPQVRGWNTHYQTFDEWLNAARNGESEAQYYVGDAYLRGERVPRDMTQAVKWLRKAADLGEHHAAYTLGLLYAEGVGVARDLNEARKWLLQAASWDLPQAKQLLVQLDRHGVGDKLQPVRDKAERGDRIAQFKLAKALLESGDAATARHWFERAAKLGHPESAFELAVLMRDGAGGARDIVAARQWCQRAADLGVMRARAALADMMKTDKETVAVAR